MSEILVPDSDVAAGGWTTNAGGTTNLFQGIDETGTVNLADYVQSALSPVADTYEFTFSNPSAILTSGVINLQIGKKNNNSVVINLKFQLLQGTTLIREQLFSDIPFTPALQQVTLTAPEIAAITDATLLRGKLIANPSLAFEMSDLGTDLFAWFSAEGGTYMTKDGSNNISQWTDRSGNGRHRTRSTMTAPTFGTNGVNCDLATFKGFDVWAANLPGNTWDVAFVALPDANPGFHTLLVDGAGGSPYIIIDAAENLASYVGGGIRQAGSQTWIPGNLRQAYFSLTANNASAMGQDGNTPAAITLAGNTYTLSNNPWLGGNVVSGQGFGRIHEIVFLSPGLSSTLRDKVTGRLAWKWDGVLGGSTLVTALPGGHPYKSVAP